MENNKDLTLNNIEDNKENIVFAVRMTKIKDDTNKFQILVADLDENAKDQLKFFIFDMFIKDKMQYMSLYDLNFLRKQGILKDEQHI
jgi:hypothetical protein